MPIKLADPTSSSFTLKSPAELAAFRDHAQTIIGALQESGMDDEAWHMHGLAETLAAEPEINEGSILRGVTRHLRAEGIESQNGQEDPLPQTLIRLLCMAAERVS